MDWTNCLARSGRVAARTIGQETFIVSPSDSTLHLLPNPVAGRIWELAGGRHTLREIHDRLCDEFEVDPAVAELDLLEFVENLVAKGLVTVGPCEGQGDTGGLGGSQGVSEGLGGTQGDSDVEMQK